MYGARLQTKKQREELRDFEINNILRNKDNDRKMSVYDLIIVTYDSIIGGEVRPCLKIYRGTAAHAMINCYYQKETQRQASIDSYVGSAENRVSSKIERQRKKKSFVPGLKVGDILYTSWGYDQTNVDFFQVIKTKGCFVTVRQLWQKQVEGTDGFMCCDVMPVKDSFRDKEPLRRKVTEGNTLRISDCEQAYPWDGKKKYTSHYA